MKRASHHRPERQAALLQEVVADILATRLKDARVGFVTVTGATVTPDGNHAVVRVSVMGSEQEKTAALAGLESARGFVRSQLARELKWRVTPELRFELDRGLEHAAKIDRILAQLKDDEAKP